MQHNKPLVSIIIPIYNTSKYLRRCLESVCAQTLKEIEIICINNGSTDNSLEILTEFEKRDSRFVIISQENTGVANARNKGLEKATAPYIGFVDSDDFIAPDMYEKMYAAMIQNNVDFVECGAELFFTYNDDNENDKRNWYSIKNLSGVINNKNLFMKTSWVIWKILFKKEILNNYKLCFAEGFSTYEDTLFVFCYKSISNKGYYIPENLYMYFFYKYSIMGKTFNKNQEEKVTETLKTIEIYLIFLLKYNIFNEMKEYFWYYFETRIKKFYSWAAPDIIQNYGIDIIRNLLKINEIAELVNIKNKKYNNFIKYKKSKLNTISFLEEKPVIKKIKKIIKYLLPYSFVRMIQKKKER